MVINTLYSDVVMFSDRSCLKSAILGRLGRSVGFNNLVTVAVVNKHSSAYVVLKSKK